MADHTIVVTIDASGAQQGARQVRISTRSVQSDLDRLFERSKETGNEFGTLVTRSRVLAAGLAGLATSGMAIAAREAINLGAAVAETSSRFETVLGPSVERANAFLEEFGTIAGLSASEGQGLVATSTAIAEGFGFAGTAAVDYSEDLIRLAGDLASFNDLATEDTFQRLTAGAAGEREALKRLGIVIRETEVQQRALVETGKENVSQLDQQERAAAFLELAYERAGKAVGDLERTQDSLGNALKQTGGLVRTFGEQGASAFAEELTPAVLEFRDALIDNKDGIVQAFRDIGIAASRVGTAFDSTVGAAIRLRDNLQEATQLPWAESFEEVAESIYATQAALTAGEEAAARSKAEFRENVAAIGDYSEALEQARARMAEIDEEGKDLAVTSENLAKAQEEYNDQLIKAVALGVQSDSELGQLRSLYRDIDDQLQNGNLALEERVRLEERRQEVLAAIADELERITRNPEIGLVGSGLARDTVTGGGAGPGGIGDREVERLRLELKRLQDQINESAAAAAGLTDVLPEAASGLVSVFDALDLLPGATRDAARGLTDILRGLDDFQSAGDGLLGLVSQIGGGLGIFGGAVGIGTSLIGGLFGGDDETERLNEQAMRLAESFARLNEQMEQDLAVRRLVAQGLNDEADALRIRIAQEQEVQDFLSSLAERFAFTLETFNLDLSSPDLMSQIEGIIAEGGPVTETFGKQLDDLLEALRTLGELEAVQELEDLARAEKEAADAAREAADALREQQRLEAEGASFRDRLALLRAELSGDPEALLAEQLRQQRDRQVEQAQALFEAGGITGEELRELIDLLNEQMNDALGDLADRLQDAAAAAEEAALAQERLLDSMEEDLRVRKLMAEGLEDEADLLRLQLDQERERQRFLEEGASDDLLRLLEEVQRLERERLLGDLAGTPFPPGTGGATPIGGVGGDIVRRELETITVEQASAMLQRLDQLVAIGSQQLAVLQRGFSVNTLDAGFGAQSAFRSRLSGLTGVR